MIVNHYHKHYTCMYCIIFAFFSVVMVEWQLPAYIIHEENVSVNVCAILNQPAERNVNVIITTASGTATGKYMYLMSCLVNCSNSYSLNVGGLDFTEVATTMVFTPGTILSCIDITINDDESLESIELFTLSLESAGDPSVEIGPLSFTTVMILDNDSMSQLIIQFLL